MDNLDKTIADILGEDDELETSPAAASTSQEPDFMSFDDVDKAVLLTERAARQVRKIRQDEATPDDQYLRVGVKGGGCSGMSYVLGFDHKNNFDIQIEREGIQVIVDKRHLMYLSGTVVDFRDGLDARGFTFENPQATDTCGCGSSFAT
ncbi:MAG: iron-sulfur cluster assembly protein IscA [Bacteroidetes bacterium HLUCCA01]|nr:MAG: iron-sulfur cluster assembly protein IscA [Bacteroidetes bacterium HLUCCA01]